MEIERFHLVLRARNFDITCRFYEQVLGLARLKGWESEGSRSALFSLGDAALEVRGRAGAAGEREEVYDYQGPRQKMSLAFAVASAEKAYEELLFRNRNIRGALRREPDGTLLFETYDPDGVPILLHEPRSD